LQRGSREEIKLSFFFERFYYLSLETIMRPFGFGRSRSGRRRAVWRRRKCASRGQNARKKTTKSHFSFRFFLSIFFLPRFSKANSNARLCPSAAGRSRRGVPLRRLR
jgi:hypothetical protein